MVRSRQSQQALDIDSFDLTANLDAARVMARALGEARPDTDRLKFARDFGFHLVAAWWHTFATSQACTGPLRGPLGDVPRRRLPQAALSLVETLGTALAQLDPESAAYQIGRIYTAMLPCAFRSAHGIYYTPPSLSARLLDRAQAAGIDWTRARVLDPACGGGAFLAPIAKRMMAALGNADPAVILRNLGTRLRGYEIDSFGAWLSQVTLDAMVLELSRASGRRLPWLVSLGDSLQRSSPRDRFDLVIGNPPYGRVRLEPAMRERYRRSLYGHANLYGLFTDLALRHVRQGGVVAYVTPTSFLAGEYFKRLRSLLGASASPLSVDFVRTRSGVFDDVLQETVLVTYRRGSTGGEIDVCELGPRDDGALDAEPVGLALLPGDRSSPWLLPRSKSQAALVARLAGMSHRLADWGYTVSTGPLVWNRHKTQLHQRAGRNRLPLIWAESISADGVFRFRAEKKNHAPFFEVRAGDQSLVVRQPCVLLQRTTAKEQARRLIAAALPADFLEAHGAVVVENHVNMIRPLDSEPAIPAEVLSAFLNSAAADRAFRCVSGSVAVSAYELEALPLPSPEDLQSLCALIASGADRRTIDAECARLYAEGGAS